MNKTLIYLAFLWVLAACPGTPANARDTVELADWPLCNDAAIAEATGSTKCRWHAHDHAAYIIDGSPTKTGKTPILFLIGGPGSLAAPQTSRLKKLSQATGRPVIVPDFGGRHKGDDCDLADDDAIWGIAAAPDDAVRYTRASQQARLDRCLDQIGDPASLYRRTGTENAAAAIVALRQVLGIESWQIVAESYGARLALEVAMRDQAAVGALVLDSPETPWVDNFWHAGKNFVAALEALSDLCRDHYFCPAKRIRLHRELLQNISDYDAAAAPALPLKNIDTGAIDAYARPTREQLLISTFGALRIPERAALLPYIAAARSPESMQTRFGLLLDTLLHPRGGLNVAMYHTLRCAEWPLDQWYTALEEDRLVHPRVAPLLRYIEWRQRYICSRLDLPETTYVVAPPMTDHPVLILSGALDPITPPNTVAAAFAAKPNRSRLVYKTLGHGVIGQRACVKRDVAAFLDAPAQGVTETSCKKSELAIRYYSPVIVR